MIIHITSLCKLVLEEKLETICLTNGRLCIPDILDGIFSGNIYSAELMCLQTLISILW